MELELASLADVVNRASLPPLSVITNSQVEEKGTLSKIWTDGVFIVVITAAAYAGCYCYEWGFTSYYNIPTDMIYISIQNLLLCFCSMIGFLVTTLQWSNMIFRIAATEAVRNSDKLVVLLLKKHGVLIGLYVLFVSPSLFSPFVVILAVIFTGFPLLAEFGVAAVICFNKEARRIYKVNSFATFLLYVKDSLTDDRPITTNTTSRQFQTVQSYAAILLLPIMLCGLLGLGVARGRTTFPFIGDSGDAIFRRYGDSFVVGRFDPHSGQLLSEFRLVKADELKERIVMRNIGMVSPIKVQWQDVRRIKNPVDEPKPVLPKGAPGT